MCWVRANGGIINGGVAWHASVRNGAFLCLLRSLVGPHWVGPALSGLPPAAANR